MSKEWPVFKNASERPSRRNIRPPSSLVLSKTLWGDCQQECCWLPQQENPPHRQAVRISTGSIHCWYSVITHRISEVLENKYITRTIASERWKPFDEVWHGRVLSSSEITGRLYLVIESFPTGRTINIVVSRQLSDSHEINASILQSSPLDQTLYINDLPMSIHRYLVTIYASWYSDIWMHLQISTWPRFLGLKKTASESNRGRSKQRINYLMSLCKRVAEQEIE